MILSPSPAQPLLNARLLGYLHHQPPGCLASLPTTRPPAPSPWGLLPSPAPSTGLPLPAALSSHWPSSTLFILILSKSQLCSCHFLLRSPLPNLEPMASWKKIPFHDIQTVNIRGPGQPGPGPVLPSPVPATLTCLCFLTHTQHPDAFVPGQTRLGCLLPLLLLPPYPCLPPASCLLQRTCSQRLSITVPQPLPGRATSSQGLLKPRVESQLFVCIFHLLHQTGSSPRADTGFESPLLPGITQSRAGPKEDTL